MGGQLCYSTGKGRLTEDRRRVLRMRSWTCCFWHRVQKLLDHSRALFPTWLPFFMESRCTLWTMVMSEKTQSLHNFVSQVSSHRIGPLNGIPSISSMEKMPRPVRAFKNYTNRWHLRSHVL